MSEAEQLAKQRTATDSLRNVSRSAAKQAGRDRKFPKASGAKIQSMDTDMMRNASRSAAKQAGRDRASGYKKGGKVCMASKRADGIAQSGKTRGMVY